MAEEVRVGFIGAGNANFGGGEGPWDHASRLEKLGGVRVVGVADPDTARAEARLAERDNPIFDRATVYADYSEMLAHAGPDAVWIGVPPDAHGTRDPGKDIEIRCAQAGVHMFVEKPLSAARPERVRPVAEAIARAGVITSVGYMFRYSRAINAMHRILSETSAGARVFLARYDCAYSRIRKAEWWDVRRSGGPIVEQATHFLDIARYLVGEADLSTVRAVRIGPAEPAGELEDVPAGDGGLPVDENVPRAFRHPRSTAALWVFADGGIGSLAHATLLHEEKYETEIEIWGDGLRMVLSDPYGRCRLRVRRPHSEETEETEFRDDDPYLAENRVFLQAVRSRSPVGIRSTYADALKTFELSWAVTDA